MTTAIDRLQAPAVAALEVAHQRACAVVEPALIDLLTARIEHTLANGPMPAAPIGDREREVAAIVDQMLVDVSAADDHLVGQANRHFTDGGLADVVMAAYIIEARTRLRVAAERLWSEA